MSGWPPVSVAHITRRARPGAHSLERVFAEVRDHLPDDVQATRLESRFASKGIVPRVAATLSAKASGFDVYHVLGDIHFVALGLPSARTVLTVLDCGPLHLLKGLRRSVLKLFWYSLPVARARVVTVISEAVRCELLAATGCAARKVRVVHCPLPSGFGPEPASEPPRLPRILCVGTTPTKNLERAAAALEGVPASVSLVGHPSAAARVAFEKHRVPLQELGTVGDAELPGLYAACDLLLFPSLYEGFGLPIIEAQAVGRPVVASSIPSLRETAGDGACLVDPHDTMSIREGIRTVLENAPYRAQLIAAGFRNARRFEAPRIAAEYAAIYREVAPDPARSRGRDRSRPTVD